MRRRVVYDSLLSFYHIEKTKLCYIFFQKINCSRKLMIRVSLGVRKISVRMSKGL